MNVNRLFLRTAVPLFGDMTCIYCVYLFFSSGADTGIMEFSFPLYILLGLLAAGVNCRLARREPTLLTVVLCNMALIAANEAILIPTMVNTSGILPYFYTVCAFAYPPIRSFFLTRTPADADVMLSYTEMSMIGTALFFLIQISDFTPPPYANAVCLMALLLHILTLSSLRMASAAKIHAQETAGIQRGVILFAAASVLIVLSLSLGLMLFPASRELIQLLLTTFWNAFRWLLHIIGRLLLYLLSLLPEPQGEQVEYEPMTAFAMAEEGMEQAEIPIGVIIAILAAAVTGVAGILVFLLIRLRKLRFRWKLQQSNVSVQKSETPRLWTLLAAALRRLLSRIGQRWLLFRKRNTCAGVFFRLEHRGRRCGMGRAPGQTPREYLMLLRNSTPPEAEAAKEAFWWLADAMDRCCFREEPVPDPDRTQVQAMLRTMRRPRAGPSQYLKALLHPGTDAGAKLDIL